MLTGAGILAALLAPYLAFAAYDDVTLSDTTLSIGDITLTVGASEATIESITVNGSSFTVTLQPQSTITVHSVDKKVMTVDGSSVFIQSSGCNSSESFLKISTVNDPRQVTLTVTPSSSTCSGNVDNSASSGGGGGIVSGGGGGVSSAPAARAQIIKPDGTVVYLDQGTQMAKSGASSGQKSVLGTASPISRALSRNTDNADVKRLQQILNSDPDTRITSTGVGAPGNESTVFGKMTEDAVKKFQQKYGIAGPGDSGYGSVGPKTRAKLNEVGGGQ
jgi:hypothetical protein